MMRDVNDTRYWKKGGGVYFISILKKMLVLISFENNDNDNPDFNNTTSMYASTMTVVTIDPNVFFFYLKLM